MTSLSQNKHVRLQGLKQDVLAFTPAEEEGSGNPAPPAKMSLVSRFSGVAAFVALGVVALLVLLYIQQRSQLQSLQQQQQMISAQQQTFAEQLAVLMGPAPEGGNEVALFRADLQQLKDRVRSHSAEQVRSSRQHQETAEQLAALGESLRRLNGQLATIRESQSTTAVATAPAPAANNAAMDSKVAKLEERLALIDQEFQALYRMLVAR